MHTNTVVIVDTTQLRPVALQAGPLPPPFSLDPMSLSRQDIINYLTSRFVSEVMIHLRWSRTKYIKAGAAWQQLAYSNKTHTQLLLILIAPWVQHDPHYLFVAGVIPNTKPAFHKSGHVNYFKYARSPSPTTNDMVSGDRITKEVKDWFKEVPRFLSSSQPGWVQKTADFVGQQLGVKIKTRLSAGGERFHQSGVCLSGIESRRKLEQYGLRAPDATSASTISKWLLAV